MNIWVIGALKSTLKCLVGFTKLAVFHRKPSSAAADDGARVCTSPGSPGGWKPRGCVILSPCRKAALAAGVLPSCRAACRYALPMWCVVCVSVWKVKKRIFHLAAVALPLAPSGLIQQLPSSKASHTNLLRRPLLHPQPGVGPSC